jgi:hypothetical protein
VLHLRFSQVTKSSSHSLKLHFFWICAVFGCRAPCHSIDWNRFCGPFKSIECIQNHSLPGDWIRPTECIPSLFYSRPDNTIDSVKRAWANCCDGLEIGETLST